MQNTNKKYCIVCGKELSNQNITGYCRTHLIEERQKQKIDNWILTGDTGFTIDTTIRGAIRDYIFREQNERCAICGQPAIWNDKELHFVLDHIDGNASNSSKDNLRLICPNCDSQLPTFKSKNKLSARNARKQYIHENYSAT